MQCGPGLATSSKARGVAYDVGLHSALVATASVLELSTSTVSGSGASVSSKKASADCGTGAGAAATKLSRAAEVSSNDDREKCCMVRMSVRMEVKRFKECGLVVVKEAALSLGT